VPKAKAKRRRSWKARTGARGRRFSGYCGLEEYLPKTFRHVSTMQDSRIE
jgi:hypothetical protein